MKWPWWGAVPGQLTIQGRRLDAPAPPLGSYVPDAYGFPGFWSTALRFPTEGCWEVTARAGDTAITFVVRAVRAVVEPTPTLAAGAPGSPAVRSSPTAIPTTIGSWGTLSAVDAREVATVVAYLDAYNAGRVDEALALLADRPAYYDCDYAGQGLTAVATTAMAGGRQAVADWLRARFADHDHITLESLGVGPNTRAVAVRIRRRTSDSLGRLGFAAGTTPQATAKWVVTPSGPPEQRAVITQVLLAGKVDDCTRL
jgi:hypothetical protein